MSPIEKMDFLKKEYPASSSGAQVIQVIQSKIKRGNGSKENPNRIVTLYRSLDGDLLAVYDPLIKDE